MRWRVDYLVACLVLPGPGAGEDGGGGRQGGQGQAGDRLHTCSRRHTLTYQVGDNTGITLIHLCNIPGGIKSKLFLPTLADNLGGRGFGG